ncbi:hypothetical protein NAT51_04135 [Flavobacterium amniphilum]|uniref:hypothetical protein n=1 Tax=Flavobacterium amniphilum TaxID=1834035 RepID=UPI00202A3B96|nr:hypothetical protein [Flavobacterium amniphilum]MCL9804697.1 hypothetical protein [Flavobacterium amniphilum]
MKRPIIINTLIFLLYLLLFSSVLFNHSGGADIFFTFCLAVCLLLHLVFAAISDFRKSQFKNTPVVVFFILITALFLNLYLELMWFVTCKL